MKNLIRMFLVVLLAITATTADAQNITNTKVKHKDNKRKNKMLYEPPRYNQGYAYPRYSGGFIGKSYYGYRSDSKKKGGFYDQKGRYYYQ